MFRTGGNQVDAGCFNAGVTQNIRQLDHVLAGFIKGSGKQVPQIMRKYFFMHYPSLLAERFHFRPNLLSGKIFTVSGEEDPAGSGFLIFRVAEQFPAELMGQKNGADLAL